MNSIILFLTLCTFMKYHHSFSFSNIFKTDTEPVANKTIDSAKNSDASVGVADKEADNFIKALKNNTDLASEVTPSKDESSVHKKEAQNISLNEIKSGNLSVVDSQPSVNNNLNSSSKSDISTDAKENNLGIIEKSSNQIQTKNATTEEHDSKSNNNFHILPFIDEKIDDNNSTSNLKLEDMTKNSNTQNSSILKAQPTENIATNLAGNASDDRKNTNVQNIPLQGNPLAELQPTLPSTVTEHSNAPQNKGFPIVSSDTNQGVSQVASVTSDNKESGKKICDDQCSAINCPISCSRYCCMSQKKQEMAESHLFLSEDNNFSKALQMGASELEKSFLDTISQLTMKISDNQPAQFTDVASQPQNYYDYLYSPSNTAYGDLFGAQEKKSDILQQDQYGSLYSSPNLKKKRTYKRNRVPNGRPKIYTPHGYNDYTGQRKFIADESWDHYSKNLYM